MRITIEFKLQDLWVGVYWNREVRKVVQLSKDIHAQSPEASKEYEKLFTHWCIDIYICLLPCFPIHIFLGEPAVKMEELDNGIHQ